jgi:hypothetical protein
MEAGIAVLRQDIEINGVAILLAKLIECLEL